MLTVLGLQQLIHKTNIDFRIFFYIVIGIESSSYFHHENSFSIEKKMAVFKLQLQVLKEESDSFWKGT